MKKKTNVPCDLREVEGTKIRQQYFNGIIYIGLSCDFMALIVLVMMSLRDQTPLYPEYLMLYGVGLLLLLPFVALSALNRFFFGEIICVINEKGIYHKNGFTPWVNIREIVYEISLPSKETLRAAAARDYPGSKYAHATSYDCCHAFLMLGKTYRITLLHAPLHLLKEAKKYHPDLRTSLSEYTQGLLTILALILVFGSIFLPFFRT